MQDDPVHDGGSSVTFVMTDIEGSTLMWRTARHAMAQAQARHDELAAEWAARTGGVRPVQQGEGDSTLIAFASVLDALRCGIGLQKAFADEPWPEGAAIRVRMGIASGPAELRDDNYFGPAISRCARIRGAAHGGQIVVPLEDRDAIVAERALDVGFEDLGLHRLKDLDAPEHLFQVVHPSLERNFPPLRSLDSVPHNLPVALTSFVGRETETTEVCEAIAHARLVTLTGIGGIGKTRLALQAGARLARGTPDGVWFADLRAISDPSYIPVAIASAIGVRAQPGRSALQTVIEHLRRREAIVILDNCEHVLEGCAQTIGTLLGACPAVRVLATSRASLGVPGGVEYHVEPLPVSGDARGESDAMRLFAERARLVDPQVAVQSDPSTVGSICRRLDGIPLAIELAAARVNVLSLEQIEERLSNRFALLDGAQRQNTLEAVLRWSYDLLNLEERDVFARASVFAGSFTLEAAEAVCAEAADIVDSLAGLIDTSLLISTHDPGGVRYHMLETVRDYGQRRLEDADPHARHARWYVEQAEALAGRLKGSDQSLLLDKLEADHDNFRTALEWSLGNEQPPEGALRLAGALWRYWVWRGHQSEGRAWLERALQDAADAPPAVVAHASRAAGILAAENGDLEIARDRFLSALEAARADDASAEEPNLLDDLGVVAMRQGKYEDARALYEQSLEIRRQSGDAAAVSNTLGNLGVVLGRLGDTTTAARLLTESLEMERAHGNEVAVAGTLCCLGEIALADNDFERAHEMFDEALRLHAKLGAREYLPSCLEGVAHVMLEQDDARSAAWLLGAAEAQREQMSVPVAPYARDEHGRLAGRVEKQLGGPAFTAAFEQGKDAPLHEWIDVARAQRAGRGE